MVGVLLKKGAKLCEVGFICIRPYMGCSSPDSTLTGSVFCELGAFCHHRWMRMRYSTERICRTAGGLTRVCLRQAK